MMALRGSSKRESTGVGSIARPPLEDGPVNTSLDDEDTISAGDPGIVDTEGGSDDEEGGV